MGRYRIKVTSTITALLPVDAAMVEVVFDSNNHRVVGEFNTKTHEVKLYPSLVNIKDPEAKSPFTILYKTFDMMTR